MLLLLLLLLIGVYVMEMSLKLLSDTISFQKKSWKQYIDIFFFPFEKEIHDISCHFRWLDQ